jgi:hypothetical protein
MILQQANASPVGCWKMGFGRNYFFQDGRKQMSTMQIAILITLDNKNLSMWGIS